MATAKKTATKAAGTKAVRGTAKRTTVRKTTARKRAPKAAVKPSGAARVPRRAIFIDVENTSSEAALFDTLDALAIDHRAQPTELTAVGNWRAVGQIVARRLAGLGAQLVHSAPARGVRDWSDLWIAVAAGCWLGQASPGDVLEIVSNDRAFDAVGDAASARGVVYRRLQHRHGGTASAATSEARSAPRPRGGRRRGRGRGRSRSTEATVAQMPAAAPPPSAHRAPVPAAPHGATAAQMAAVIQRLTNGEPSRWVNLDVLEKALKADGFTRPPGSPRLVTRLRALKEMEVDAHGRVRLRQPSHTEPSGVPASADN